MKEAELTEQAKVRLEICKVCKYKNIVEKNLVCSLCGCWLLVKTSVPENSCPSGYW